MTAHTESPAPQSPASEMSLHQRIVSDIEGKIVSGEWPPGHRIPFEMELTAHYQCSRMTVNKAITQLARAGLVERRKKSGSFVLQPHVQMAVLEIRDLRSEVQALGLVYRYDVALLRKRKANSADRLLLSLDQPTPVLEVQCHHYAGARIFCFEHRLINLLTVPEAGVESFAETAPGAWLLQRVPWSAAEHRIRAIAADAHMAQALGVALHSACLVIERRTTSNGAYVTHVELTYPGSSHELVARFTPSQGR